MWVSNADGTGRAQLTSEQNAKTPAWSPNGTQIAFTSKIDGNQEVYVMSADGSNKTRLTNNPAADSSPDWGP